MMPNGQPNAVASTIGAASPPHTHTHTNHDQLCLTTPAKGFLTRSIPNLVCRSHRRVRFFRVARQSETDLKGWLNWTPPTAPDIGLPHPGLATEGEGFLYRPFPSGALTPALRLSGTRNAKTGRCYNANSLPPSYYQPTPFLAGNLEDGGTGTDGSRICKDVLGDCAGLLALSLSSGVLRHPSHPGPHPHPQPPTPLGS